MPNTDPFARKLRATSGYLLKRAQQMLEAIVASEQFGDLSVLSQIQFEVLVAAKALPESDQVTIGKALGIDKSSITAVLDALERLNLLNRKISGDRRRKRLSPGPRLDAVLAKGWAIGKRADARLLAPLPASEQTMLTEILWDFAGISDSQAPEWTPVAQLIEGIAGKACGLGSLYTTPGFLLRRCLQVGKGFASQAISPSDFTEGQAKVLYLICALGTADISLLQMALATKRPTLRVILDTLEVRGLIYQDCDPVDARRKRIAPTPQGVLATEAIRDVWERIERSVEKRLTSAMHRRLIALLQKLTTASSE